MQPILAITLPFFALVLMGYAAAWKRVLPESAIPGLNTFVLYFALPALLFRFGMNTPIGQLLNPVVVLVSMLASLGIVAFTIAVTLSARVQMKDAAFGALVAAFPNTGFMGVPLLTALLGAAAAGPVICAVLVDLFVTSSVCIALAQAHEAKAAGTRAALIRAMKGALSNPLPWSIAFGVLCSVLGWKLTGALATILNMLADAASPVALFTIGAVLWRAGQHAHTRTPASLVLPVAAIKLFAHPLLVFALAAGTHARAVSRCWPSDTAPTTAASRASS
jgi:malonate transporter and related proteins